MKKIFYGIESLLYIVFLYLDFFTIEYKYSNYLKFISIVGCFIYIVLEPMKRNEMDKKERGVLRIALFFTVLADICLLLIDAYEIGIIFFLIVQFCYLYRLYLLDYIISIKKQVCYCFFLWCGLIFFLFFVNILIDIVLLLSVLYFIMIAWNTGITIVYWKKNWMFSMGMCLFLCCDINVGLYNINQYIPEVILASNVILEKLMDYSKVAMWAFYLPAQVLLISSIWNKKSNYLVEKLKN